MVPDEVVLRDRILKRLTRLRFDRGHPNNKRRDINNYEQEL